MKFGLGTVTVATVLILALIVATVIATDRSRARTACLQSTQTAEECPTPSAWETMLRSATAS